MLLSSCPKPSTSVHAGGYASALGLEQHVPPSHGLFFWECFPQLKGFAKLFAVITAWGKVPKVQGSRPEGKCWGSD